MRQFLSRDRRKNPFNDRLRRENKRLTGMTDVAECGIIVEDILGLFCPAPRKYECTVNGVLVRRLIQRRIFGYKGLST